MMNWPGKVRDHQTVALMDGCVFNGGYVFHDIHVGNAVAVHYQCGVIGILSSVSISSTFGCSIKSFYGAKYTDAGISLMLCNMMPSSERDSSVSMWRDPVIANLGRAYPPIVVGPGTSQGIGEMRLRSGDNILYVITNNSGFDEDISVNIAVTEWE